nr:hypothetical protein [Crinalium epipsammum]
MDEKLQQVGATLTGVLDSMEERGVIRRERDRLTYLVQGAQVRNRKKFYRQLLYRWDKLCKGVAWGTPIIDTVGRDARSQIFLKFPLNEKQLSLEADG